jgi:plastocyanin
VSRRATLAAPLAALAALAAAPAASGQGVAVQAVDGTPTDPLLFHWSPAEVTIKAGETVTWRFEGTTALHNVISQGTNWSYRSGPFQSGHPPAQFRFPAPGEYRFACEVHASTMLGKVIVTDLSGTPSPPPPPPPPSEQPWQNDERAPTVLELERDLPPLLTRVRAAPVPHGARVRFRLSERARVVVRFKLAGLTVKTASRPFRAGRRSMTVSDRRLNGRYRLDVFARDAAGNRSRIRREWLTIR